MNRATVTTELRRQFFPILRAAGFHRKGEVLFRELPGPVAQLVEVQHRPSSGVFRVNLGAHLPALDGTAAVKLRESGCAWRSSIVSGFRTKDDSDFAYGGTEADAAESVAFLVSEWDRQSAEFFRPLSDFPAGFHECARESLAEDLHPAHRLTWAKVARLVGDDELARRIAEQALPDVPERATTLRAQLEALLG